MHRRGHVAIAVLVFGAGVAAALPFRQTVSPPAERVGPETDWSAANAAPLVLQHSMPSQPSTPAPRLAPLAMPSPRRSEAEPARPRPAEVNSGVAAQDRKRANRARLKLPEMAPSFEATIARPKTHQVRDGDTLPSLAARYLNDATRAGELFDANRDVLEHPDLLPIGVELTIP